MRKYGIVDSPKPLLEIWKSEVMGVQGGGGDHLYVYIHTHMFIYKVFLDLLEKWKPFSGMCLNTWVPRGGVTIYI